MEFKDYYINLGKVIYAIAKADGTIQQEEIDTFRDDLKELLLPLNEDMDEFGMDISFYSEFEFEKLMDQSASVESTFNSFVKFVDENHAEITKEMREVSVKMITNVANAYMGIIEEERVLIEKVKEKLGSN